MLLRYYSQFDGQPMLAHVNGARIKIGSAPGNDIVLQSPFVDAQAIELTRQGTDGWELRVLGLNGCEANGQKLAAGASMVWSGTTPLNLFPFVFYLQTTVQNAESPTRRFSHEIHQLVKQVHLDLLQQMHLSGSADDIPRTTEALVHLERSIESAAAYHGLAKVENGALAAELAGACVRDELLTRLLDRESTAAESLTGERSEWSELATAIQEREEDLKRWALTCSRILFESLEDDRIESRIDQVEKEFWSLWDKLSSKLMKPHCEYLALRQLKKQVKDILFGFGPLEDLLRMPTITEIMVNASDEIYVEKSGVLQNSGRQFVSDEVTLTIIDRIVSRVGRHVDTAQPMVDARLPDGSRVNAIIPPLAVKGPTLTIRKFAREPYTMQKLIDIGTLTPQVAEFLQACVRAKRSILVSGGTGTGKTTLLNCLSRAIPIRERIICIEDTHELQLDHPHVVFTECRDGNNEGKGKIVIRDLLKNALRQRPDRIVVGECRSDEALDMLQAMNTGHDGSMTTIHANAPVDALRRLEVLVRDSGLPSDAVRQQIASAIDIVVQLRRLPGGTRCVTEVTEVVGYEEQQQRIRLRTIFGACTDAGLHTAGLRPTGCLPSFACELVRDNHVQLDLFLGDTYRDQLPSSKQFNADPNLPATQQVYSEDHHATLCR